MTVCAITKFAFASEIESTFNLMISLMVTSTANAGSVVVRNLQKSK
jgi:hypothetical protein